jgi:tRNA (mo5U34)-methyltransferase
VVDPQLLAEVQAIQWWHCIDLGNGLITPGQYDARAALPHLGIPQDLRGKTVLDIGAWDGFFSFVAEQRGANRVLATDYYCWSGPCWGTRAGFDLARRVLNSRVEDREIDVLDLAPESMGTFDLVLFLGVLYHMRHPMLALEKVASVCADQLILETHLDMHEVERPALAFYPADELNRDGSNWFGPNPAAVDAMLRVVGFKQVRLYARDFLPDRGVFHAWR